MICLTHIPKTGGTTFRNILINNFSWRHLDFPVFPKREIQPDDFPLNSPLLLSQLRSLSGHRLHYSDGLHSKFPDFKFVVFLREPIARIISLYFHIQRFENPGLVFRDWVYDNYNTPLLSNSQALFVAGVADFDRAKSILEHRYFFAGCMERFDESLLLFKRMVEGDFDVRYVKKNVAPRAKDEIFKDGKNRDALDMLYQHNEIDIKLYTFVKQVLIEKYKEEYGAVTEGELAYFNNLNQYFRPNFIKKNMFRVVKYGIFEILFRMKNKAIKSPNVHPDEQV